MFTNDFFHNGSSWYRVRLYAGS